MATRAWLADLLPRWEETTGLAIELESAGGVDAARRVSAGEPFDVVLLAADALERLASAGRVSVPVELARSDVVAAVRADDGGAWDVESEERFLEALHAARAIGLSTGPSGAGLQRYFGDRGLAEALSSRVVVAPPGIPVAQLLRDGTVSLGFQQRPELIHESGVRLLGALPGAAAVTTVFAGAVGAATTSADHAHDLLRFLARSPVLDAARERHGFRGPA